MNSHELLFFLLDFLPKVNNLRLRFFAASSEDEEAVDWLSSLCCSLNVGNLLFAIVLKLVVSMKVAVGEIGVMDPADSKLPEEFELWRMEL